MVLRNLIWLLYFACAFTATHLPPSKLPSTSWLNDKAQHTIGFTVLGFVTYWRFGPRRSARTMQEPTESTGSRLGREDLNRVLSLAAFLAVYALIDESTQPLVGRSCEAADWLADMAGTAIGLIAGIFCFRNRSVSR